MKKLILLPLGLILFAAPMADDILVEGFEGGSIPGDWQVWEEGTYYYGYEWYTYDGADYAHSGTWSAWRDYGYYYPGGGYTGDDSWLVTPSLDVTGYENLSFSCWYLGYGSNSDDPDMSIMVADVASPGPGDFTQLLDMGPPPATYEQRTADASAYDGEANVTFAFHFEYSGPGTWSNQVGLDDVLVTADVTAVESASLGEIKAIYR